MRKKNTRKQYTAKLRIKTTMALGKEHIFNRDNAATNTADLETNHILYLRQYDSLRHLVSEAIQYKLSYQRLVVLVANYFIINKIAL